MSKKSDFSIPAEEMIIADNGTPIYYYPNEFLHGFFIGLYIKTGSMYETDDMNGSTHLWEHIIFRKLNQLNNGTFYQMLDTLGLSFSACTYREFVSFKISGAAKHFKHAVDIITQVFAPVNLSGKEVELEKKRIKAEIREDGELYSLDYFSQKIVWEGTPLQNTIAGKNKVLDRLGPKALQGIQDKILSEGNLFFYVTGCFDDESIRYLSQSIGRHLLTKNLSLHQNIAPVPKAFFHRNGHIAVKNSAYHYMRFSFDIDISRYTYAELDLLYDILFSGDTSKIYQELSEKAGFIYDFDTRLERYCNIGNLYVSFEVQKKNIVHAVERVIAVLKGLKNNITNELSFVLPAYTDNAELILDAVEDLNWNMAYECHIMNCKYKNIEERKIAYRNITPERIMEMAREIFVLDNLVFTIKTDKKGFNVEAVRQVLADL